MKRISFISGPVRLALTSAGCCMLFAAWQAGSPFYGLPTLKSAKQTALPSVAKFELVAPSNQSRNLGRMFAGPQSALNYWDTVQTGNPQIIVNEDFTDGAFDNLGAFNTQYPARNNNWSIFGGGVAFRPAQGRTTFPLSLARKPALGGADWEGAQYQVFQDLNNDGQYTTDEKKKWFVDKKDEVCVVEYTSFGDLAAKPETYGTEVAMLEDVSDPVFQGNPHYGHDLSFEVVQGHTVDRSQPMVQLEPNVENTGNRSNIGVLRAHYTSWPDDNITAREYSQTVIWRNRPGTGTTNIEQWGTLRHGDLSVAKEMNSDLEPSNRYSVFNNIQISIFRAGIRTSNPIFVRSTIAARDSAQIGILNCKVGITKKSDFDLSYSVGASDAAVLTANLGRRDSANIRTGDADNNDKVDANDANALIGLWTEAFTPFDTVKAIARYQPSTGHIILNLRNVSYLKISSLNRRLIPNNLTVSNLNPTGYFATDSAMVFYNAGEFTGNDIDLGPIAQLNLPNGELSLRINYKKSGESEGFIVPFTTGLVTNTVNNGAAKHLLNLNGKLYSLPTGYKTYQLMLLTLDGKLVKHQTLTADAQTQNWQITQPLPHTPLMLVIMGDDKKRILTQVYSAE